jgi:hypothetical protein
MPCHVYLSVARFLTSCFFVSVSMLKVVGANGQTALLHDFMPAPTPTQRASFPIPAALIRSGAVRVECHQPSGLCQNGNGRGCQISEVWLQRQGANPNLTGGVEDG